MPLIRVEIKRRNERKGDVLEKRGKSDTPVRNGGVRNRNVVQNAHDEGYFAKRVTADEEHDDGRDDDVNRITHALEVCFAEE